MRDLKVTEIVVNDRRAKESDGMLKEGDLIRVIEPNVTIHEIPKGEKLPYDAGGAPYYVVEANENGTSFKEVFNGLRSMGAFVCDPSDKTSCIGNDNHKIHSHLEEIKTDRLRILADRWFKEDTAPRSTGDEVAVVRGTDHEPNMIAEKGVIACVSSGDCPFGSETAIRTFAGELICVGVEEIEGNKVDGLFVIANEK